MSTFAEKDVPCPHCGKMARRIVSESLNLGRSPWYAQAILDGTFQVFRCADCHQKVVVDHPLIVIDFSAKRWIACYPRQWETTWVRGVEHAEATYRDALITHAPPVAATLREGLLRRVVYGFDALREKLVALMAGLDDVWLEAFKLNVWRAQMDLAFGPDARPRLVTVGETLDFHATATDGTGRVLRIEQTALTRFREDASEGHGALVKALSESAYVDLGRVMFFPEGG